RLCGTVRKPIPNLAPSVGRWHSQQTFELGQKLRMGPVPWPHHFVHENTTLIYNKALWHTRRSIEALHEIFRVEPRREAETVALHKRFHHLRPQGIEADRQDFEPAAV